MHTQINLDLKPSNLIYSLHPTSVLMVRFRLGLHNLSIETDRWIRRPRPERECGACGELDNEEHVLFRCSSVRRDDLSDDLSAIKQCEKKCIIVKTPEDG